MEKTCVVNVATGQHYLKGQRRLLEVLRHYGEVSMLWTGMPKGCPSHEAVPYAFKAFALAAAMESGFRKLLWADASIVPIQKLNPIWDYAAEHGVWLANNGWTNYEWTAESAYPALFQGIGNQHVESWIDVNRAIPHVVATAMAIDVDHPRGRQFLEEYYWLAAQTQAFAGPWINSNYPGAPPPDGKRCAPCGAPDVRGHRHDQTAASVLAWRLGVPLTQPPAYFAYHGQCTAETILDADGGY